ncbi:RHS repeat-associated core domain-containing protein, partial [Anaerocolumna jejuensis]|uniref:RHS repeat-associated core domain-containing protein n=1 Tax=Anaerocolumna jejuensis TaxID=259063 RepID=UPI003F7C3620
GYTYDNAGNLLKDGKNQYTYDAFHRTSRVETFDGAIQINRYDVEGLRHEMEENGNLVQFIFRGTEVAAEESKGEIKRYIRSDVLLASDAESARTYYHYASDELGSITHVTEGEEVLNRYEYDAWGNVTESQEKVENRFQFNGQQFDSISQQYYLRARYYNPVIGRFTQEDTYRGDGLNLYAYCTNNPVYYVDPSGNICKKSAESIMDKVSQGQASKNEQKKLAAYLRNKQNDGELTIPEKEAAKKLGVRVENKDSGNKYNINGKEWNEYFKKKYGTENVGADPCNWSDEQIQRAIDSIHNAQYGDSHFGNKNPYTLSVTDNNDVIISAANSKPGPAAREKGYEIFGEGNVVFVSGGQGTEYSGNTINNNHSEARGIQYMRDNGIDTHATRQATTLYSCDPCVEKQTEAGILNITGRAKDHNGKYSRTKNSN